jgi:PEGA domain
MKKILLLSLAAALLSACSTMTFNEDVAVDSKPCGADIFVNGELMGQTPATLSLDTSSVYEIKLAKKGYKDQTVSLASIRANPLVKFGPLVDMGYYKELTPAPVNEQLKPDFLPATKGLNAFGDMASNIVKVDQMRKDGKISPEEHSYLLFQITEFYSK